MLNYTGLEYLKIDIANHFGIDKLPFAKRIIWVDANEHRLTRAITKAKDPFRYAAAVQAYRNTQQNVPTGHLVGMDACASGIQIMSALTGCKMGAKNTGLIGQSREDFYTHVTTEMNLLLGHNVSYTKEEIKPPTMTYFYGSRQKPIDAFGDNTPELKAFHTAVANMAPGAYELRNMLLASWQSYADQHSWSLPDGFTVHNKVLQMKDTKIEVDELDHTTFIYRHEINTGSEDGLANAANVVHSVDGFVNRELCRRCNYSITKLEAAYHIINLRLKHWYDRPTVKPLVEQLAIKQGFISLIGAEYITNYSILDFSYEYLLALWRLLDDVLKRPTFEVITVHDEFKAHANNMNYVRQTYIEIFAELAESDILNQILTELTGNVTALPKLSPDLGDYIRKGNYALS